MNMLSAWAFAPIVIVAQMSGWTCGRFIRKRLPAEHLAPTTRDAVVLAVGMVATLSALVLGLMISTAKTSFDADRASVVDIAGNILMMDRVGSVWGRNETGTRSVARIDAAGDRGSRRGSAVAAANRAWTAAASPY